MRLRTCVTWQLINLRPTLHFELHLDAIIADIGKERGCLTAASRRSQMRLVVDNDARP
jgi:hypothetical protein